MPFANKYHSIRDFQSYLQRFQFQRKRIGFLYFTYIDNEDGDESKQKKCKVEAIYGMKHLKKSIPMLPPKAVGRSLGRYCQTDYTNVRLAKECLDLWTSAPREDGFVLSAAEVNMAIES